MTKRFYVYSTDTEIVGEVKANLPKPLADLERALNAKFNFAPLSPVTSIQTETRARAAGFLILEEGDDGIVREA